MPTDADLVDAWLAHLQHNRGRSDATAAKYRGYVIRLASYAAAEGTSLTALDADALEAWSGLQMHREGLSPRSRRALVAALRGFYAWADRQGHVRTNPAQSLPYPTAGRPLPRAMQLRSAERLLMSLDISTFPGVRDAAVLSVLMGCGLRLSGVVGLNQSSLVWAEQEGQEWLVIRTREKGGRERVVPAPHEARLLIRAYLGHAELEGIDRSLPSGDQVLFVSQRNRSIPPHQYHGEARRLSARSVRDMVVRYGRRLGIPRDELHPHAMRHLYGTELAEDDVDLLLRKALMGHTDANSTEIYSHLATRKLTKVVERSNPLAKVQTPVTDLLRHMREHL